MVQCERETEERGGLNQKKKGREPRNSSDQILRNPISPSLSLPSHPSLLFAPLWLRPPCLPTTPLFHRSPPALSSTLPSLLPLRFLLLPPALSLLPPSTNTALLLPRFRLRLLLLRRSWTLLELLLSNLRTTPSRTLPPSVRLSIRTTLKNEKEAKPSCEKNSSRPPKSTSAVSLRILSTPIWKPASPSRVRSSPSSSRMALDSSYVHTLSLFHRFPEPPSFPLFLSLLPLTSPFFRLSSFYRSSSTSSKPTTL